MAVMTPELVRAFTTNDLQHEYENFVRRPSATNWNALLGAMLVHQQAADALANPERAERLVRAVQSVTFGEFGDTVTRVCMGKTIAEALAER